jgi:molecular chaperone GrpE
MNPDGEPEGDNGKAEAEGPMTNDAPAGMDARGPGEPMKAQAYVDPSIAAEAQLAALEAEKADLKDRYIRVHAEMENLRKRTEREKADTSKYAISKFAGDMLAVADNLQRALAAFAGTGAEPDAQTKALIDGIELTAAELGKAMERHGVRQVESLGAIFDPNFHQAVMEEENKDIAAGTVIRVFQEGYQIGERLLRPSMVVVARGGFKPVKKDADAANGAHEQTAAANDDTPPTPETAEPPTADNDPSNSSPG